MSLLLRNLLFTVLVPGTVAVTLPMLLAGGRAPRGGPGLLLAAALFAAGGGLYAWCVWDFARFGRGTRRRSTRRAGSSSAGPTGWYATRCTWPCWR